MSKARALLVDVPLKAAGQWWSDDAMTLAAALAYYTVFSLAPLLIISLSVAGLVVGEEAARGQLKTQIGILVGADGARVVEDTLANIGRERETTRLATVLGIATLVIGSTGVFAQLQASLNAIWGVKAAPSSARHTVWQLIRVRLLSFGMVLAVGFLLLVSLVASTFLNAMHGHVDQYLSQNVPSLSTIWWYVHFFLSLALASLFFMLIFKVLPDVEVSWSDVWIGAIATAILFGIGKFLIGFYLGNSAVGSSYGAAGSLVVVLIWVWFSGCILYYGAEFTQVYARNFGSRITPAEYAERVEPERAVPDQEVEEEVGETLHPEGTADAEELRQAQNAQRRQTPVARRHRKDRRPPNTDE